MSYRRLQEHQWRALFERFERSGSSRTAFCEQEGVALSTFDAWRRKVAVRRDPSPARFIELHLPEAAPTLARCSAEPEKSADLTVELPYGVVIRFHGVRQ